MLNKALLEFLGQYRGSGVCLAFSGGVDSALLLALLAREKIPVTALTFQTVLHPAGDMACAAALAAEYRVPHRIIQVDELANEKVLANPPDRCYHCKRQLFETLAAAAEKEGLGVPMDGTNAGDLLEYRPGLRALSELGVVSPLAVCGIYKKEVRQMAAELGLKTASKPASPCMATRLPYGERITPEKLARIEAGEAFLKGLGFPVCRLRSQGDLCRIEVPRTEIPQAAALHAKLSEGLAALGFAFVTLDMKGFRSGSYDQAAGLTARTLKKGL